MYNPILIPYWSKIKILTKTKISHKFQTQNFSDFLVFSPILLESSIEQKFAVLQPLKRIIWNDLLRSNPGQVQIYLTILITIGPISEIILSKQRLNLNLPDRKSVV